LTKLARNDDDNDDDDEGDGDDDDDDDDDDDYDDGDDNDVGDVLLSCKQAKGQAPKQATAPSSSAAMTTNKVFEGIGDDDL